MEPQTSTSTPLIPPVCRRPLVSNTGLRLAIVESWPSVMWQSQGIYSVLHTRSPVTPELYSHASSWSERSGTAYTSDDWTFCAVHCFGQIVNEPASDPVEMSWTS
jgi:hypothetical protein